MESNILSKINFNLIIPKIRFYSQIVYLVVSTNIKNGLVPKI